MIIKVFLIMYIGENPMSIYKIRDAEMEESAVHWNGKLFRTLVEVNSFETAMEVIRYLGIEEYEYIDKYKYLRATLSSQELKNISMLSGVHFIWKDNGEI